MDKVWHLFFGGAVVEIEVGFIYCSFESILCVRISVLVDGVCLEEGYDLLDFLFSFFVSEFLGFLDFSFLDYLLGDLVDICGAEGGF